MKIPTYLGISLFFSGAIFLSVVVPSFPQEQKPPQPQDTSYTYKKNIKPMLQANCNPCHFEGGKVWAKLPFDNYKTVASLGKKLNTRFKEKKQKAIVNGWVALGTKE